MKRRAVRHVEPAVRLAAALAVGLSVTCGASASPPEQAVGGPAPGSSAAAEVEAVPDTWSREVTAKARRGLAPAFEKGATAAGIVVVSSGRATTIAIGKRSQGGPDFTDDTLFEVGSVSKVFVGLTLAKAAAQGDVVLSDPVNLHLRGQLTVPRQGGVDVTWARLFSDKAISIT